MTKDMSYLLHIWEHPNTRTWPASVEEADQFISIAHDIKIGENPKYIAFADALTGKYPDLTSIEETENGDELENVVWTDSPLNGRTDSPVYVIGIVTAHLNEDLLNFIARAACDQNLHMFDMQAGMLYCPDRTTVNLKGDARVIYLASLGDKTKSIDDLGWIVSARISDVSVEGAAKTIIHDIAPYYSPDAFMPHVPITVQRELKEQTRELPVSADAFEIWYFPKYSAQEVAGLTKEEIERKKQEDVRKVKQRLLDGMIAVHKYLKNFDDPRLR